MVDMSNIIEDVDDTEYLLFKPVRIYLNLQILCYFVMFISAVVTVPYIVFIPLFGLLSAQSRKNRVEFHLGYTICFTLICIVTTYIYLISELLPNISSLIILWITTATVLGLEILIMRKMKGILREKFEQNMIILFEKSKISDKLSFAFVTNLLDINQNSLILAFLNRKEKIEGIEFTKTEIILANNDAKRAFIKVLEERFRP